MPTPSPPARPPADSASRTELSRPRHSAADRLRAVLWMGGTLLSLSLMALAARELSATLDTFQILFLRNVVGFAVILLVLTRRGVITIRTRRLGLHALRNLVHLGGTGSWFYGIALMPLAEVFVLESTLPIWAVLLAVPFLGERLTGPRVLAVALGFVGVLVILRPGLAIVDPVALIVLAGAVCFGAANVATKRLTETETPLTILFWMFLIQLLASAGPALPGLTLPGSALWPAVLAVGLTGLSAHYCTARSLALAEAGLVIPMHFLRLPLIAWLGWMLYGETVDPWLWVGAVVIFVGTFINVRGTR